jgi:thioredoxin-like negative regulator of GroEL
MLKDQFGNNLTTTSKAARDAYVKGVDLYLAADAGVEQTFSEAIAADENFALAHLALARYWQTIGQGRKGREVLQPVANLCNDLTDRELGHINAISLLLEGNSEQSYQAVQSHLLDYPRDVMVAQTLLKQGNTGEAKRLLEMRRPFATNLTALSGVDSAI